MNVASLSGVIGAAAGAPLAQTRGTDGDRAAQETTATQREVKNAERAADAAGIGQTDEDQEAGDRDADGRRMWERAASPGQKTDSAAVGESPVEPPSQQVKDPSGECGSLLDVTG